MLYIKPSKKFKAEFNKEEIKEIFEMFQRLTGVEWSEENERTYTDFLRNSYVVYPESDKHDDTEGIKPKQLKKILKVLSLKETESWFDLIKSRRLGNYFEDGYFSYKRAFDELLLEELENKDFKSNLAKEIITKNKPQGFDYYRYDDEVYEALMEGKITFDTLQPLLTERLYEKGKVIKLKNLDLKDFYKEKEDAWQEHQKFVPKLQILLMLNPKYFNRQAFSLGLEYHYGKKQLGELSAEDQKEYIKLYKIFGPHIDIMKPFIKEKKYLINKKISENNIFLYDKLDQPNPVFLKIFNESLRGIHLKLEIGDFEKYLTSLTYYKWLTEDLSKKDRITIDDLKNLEEIFDFIKGQIKAGSTDKEIMNQDPRINTIINKYVQNPGPKEKDLIKALYAKTCHIKTKIPLFSGKIGDYVWEMLDKNDIRGLVAGNAVNCCQRIGGLEKRAFSYGGANCVYAGAEEEEQTFFIISKKDRIVAQSWVWMKNGQLTFDNIEVLGQEVRDPIKNCYEAYAKECLSEKNKIKVITVGAGNSDMDLEKYWKEYSDFELIKEAYDARSTQYVISKR